MSRLIHLNGPPGIGKSTLARRFVDERPGVLNCDVDVLRTLIGGWQSDFARAGALIRPAALAMIEAYLGDGNDVVFPQMWTPQPPRWRDSTVGANPLLRIPGATRCAPLWPRRVGTPGSRRTTRHSNVYWRNGQTQC